MPSFPPSIIPLILTPQALTGEFAPGRMMNQLIGAMLKAGHDWDDLPPDLRATYALGYYVGNVLNGGNSQFVHNAFTYYDVGPLRMLQGAELAASVYGMPQTREVIAQLRDWIIAHPNEARQQTGFSGGRAEALEPLDDALMEADKVDEADWLAILAPLGPEVAARLAKGMGYKNPDYPMTFPQRRSALHEMVFLLNREPRLIVEEDALPAAVAAIAALPSAKAMRKALIETRDRLPKPANCAILDLLNTSGFWKGRPDDARLGPVLARPGKAPGAQEAVLRVVGSKDHISAILAPDGTLTIHATTGDPAPMFGIHQVTPPIKIRGLLSLLRWFSRDERKKRHVAKAFAAFSATEGFRLTGVIAQGTITPGTRIARTMDEMHIAEAIASHIATRTTGPLNTARLLRWRDGPDPVQDWLFSTTDGTLIEVLGRPDTVLIRKPGADALTPYARANLTGLRRAIP